MPEIGDSAPEDGLVYSISPASFGF